LSAADGRVVWQYDTVREYKTVNGVEAKGGSMGAAGPTAAGGMLFAPSGYIGVKSGLPGNVLLAFAIQPE
jgi:polyvinyl alcohol dehydrogenase (cytochrome)